MIQARLAKRTNAITASATLALNARAKQLASTGHTVYNLTAGELSIETPPYIRSAVATKLNQNKYSPVNGLPELRQAIANHARKFYGLNWIEPENVVVTGGAKPAIYAALLSLIDPGDEVIVPTPAWVSYIDLISLAGGRTVNPPLTEKYDLDVNAIKAAVTAKTKAIIINSPHNPTGAVFSKSAIDQLAKALRHTEITLISDDIYTRLIFSQKIALAASANFKSTVIINGFSKSQALTGWRIGYLIANQAISATATSLLSHITGNAPLPSQYAALAALSRGDQPPKAVVNQLLRNRSLALNRLSEIPEIKHNQPDGAFYIFLDLRQITSSSLDWCEALLNNTGVALVPGDAFMAPGFARLTFAGNPKELATAIDRIKQFVKKSS